MLGTDTSPAQNADGTGGEVLTRGPVHEAFAATVSYDPEPGILVDAQPPAAIEEVPPGQRMEGKNVAWIPGYWAWDEDSNDFLWISGIWRNLPPGRQWVPGYWAQADGRHQWTSGYWEDAEATEVSYLPKPPHSVEAGPNIEAPSRDQSWQPGSWAWRDDRYAWRAGYWAPVRENWIWVPSYYRWTPRGYVYVDGYWDYAVVRRGVLFAPVRFGRDVYSRPGFYYSPTTVISLAVFVNHLFLRPNYGHYYFGDYYAPNYRDHGYYASYAYSTSRHGFDPIYSHYRWENRNNRTWDLQRRDYFEYRRDNEDARPSRTWAALISRPEADRRHEEGFDVAQPLDRLVNSGDGGRQRFQAVDKKDREHFLSQRQEIGKYARERQQLETREVTTSADQSSDRATAARVKVSRSPVVSKQSDRPGKGEAPPERLAPRASEQAKQKGRDGEKGDNAEPAKLPRAETQVEPAREKDHSERRREADSGKSRKEESRPAEVREPKSKPMPREAEPAPARTVEPTAPKKVEQRQPEPKPRERTEPKKAPQVQPQPSRRAEPAPAERPQIQRPQPEPKQLKPAHAAPKQPQVEHAPRPETSKEKASEHRKKDKVAE